MLRELYSVVQVNGTVVTKLSCQSVLNGIPVFIFEKQSSIVTIWGCVPRGAKFCFGKGLRDENLMVSFRSLEPDKKFSYLQKFKN